MSLHLSANRALLICLLWMAIGRSARVLNKRIHFDVTITSHYAVTTLSTLVWNEALDDDAATSFVTYIPDNAFISDVRLKTRGNTGALSGLFPLLSTVRSTGCEMLPSVF